MKGLLKNNYFAVRSNAKAFSVFMLLLGIFVVENQFILSKPSTNNTEI